LSRPFAATDWKGTIFDLPAIETSLCEVEANFATINSQLGTPREPLDRLVVRNLMSGYDFIDKLINSKVDLFALGQLRLFLELNALVLCGRDEQVRLDSTRHLAATDRYFFDNVDGGIRDVVEWYALHSNDSVWFRAAGVYIRILSEPELFIEGNHRTGALVMSYILGRDCHPPFVLTADGAKDFFDWSTLFSAKRKSGFLLRWQMPSLTRKFAEFLVAQADPRFLRAHYD
jgi:hypothetical protein